jgi:hypothetical protein
VFFASKKYFVKSLSTTFFLFFSRTPFTMTKFGFILLLLPQSYSLFAQIHLQNPSLEGTPRENNTPAKWQACGYYSTPDMLPGAWGVSMAAKDGKTYVGLTARDDNSYEAMGQMLTEPLRAGQCYSMGIDLARSDAYASYNRPIRLRVWGGKTACEKTQLLASSPTVANGTWKHYTLYFFPKKDVQFLTLEAFYADGTVKPYRGNILLDHIGTIDGCMRADITPKVTGASN